MVRVAATLLNDNTEFARLLEGDWIYMVPVFNIAVFCFSAQYIVPEMARGFSHAPERLRIASGVPSVKRAGQLFVTLAPRRRRAHPASLGRRTRARAPPGA